MPDAQALWIEDRERPALRSADVMAQQGEVVVEALFSGISRGTEGLVFRGKVPSDERVRMRCPLQEGEFPFPVKYGYASVGRIAEGARAGETVFVLHPHQSRFACPQGMAMPLPPDVPPERAVLAANMETALNVLWDGGAAPGDRIAVIGAGTVGCLAGWLGARLPGAEVTLIDVLPERRALAERLGCDFALPADAPGEADLVIHASSSEDGLATALRLAGREATVVEASWYGDRAVSIPLGGSFHSRRIRLVASQVGGLPSGRTARWNHARRLAKALVLLADPALDALISGETRFADLPGAYAAILADAGTLCHRVRY